jgi:hypothetical protein
MPDSIIKEALEKFEESQTGSDLNRRDAHEDILFARLADQWPAKIKKEREAEGRPCLTINRLPVFIRQIVNEARQNTPAIKVTPSDNYADVKTAEVINGLVRAIQNGRRKADIAYDTAIEHAISGGFGFFRVGIDYVDSETFDMEAYIDRIPNPLMVHWDVSTTEFDSSDWDYAFVSDFLTPEKFKQRYPDAAAVSFEGQDDEATAYWMDQDRIRIAEYFTRTEGKRKIVQLNDGQTMRRDAMADIAKSFFEKGGIDLGGQVKDDEIVSYFLMANKLEITREREATFHEVSRRIITGQEVLEDDPWPGSVIPICPVWGDEVIIDGYRHFRSLIRDAKDPQLMFNFWRTAATELVALAPRAPWVIPVGSIPKGAEDKWETANTRSHAYLEYQAAPGIPMPQRQPFAGVPAGAIQEALSAADDMKAITGIYDSALGAQSNEVSGRAIMARERQTNTSNFHFLDNLNRAIEGAGRILVEIIPAVYSGRQTLRILGENKKEDVVHLMSQDGGSQEEGLDGEQQLYNLSVGRYDVAVEAGVNYATARQETRETLIEIMKQVPGAAQFIGDIVIEHMDFEGADVLAKRLKMLLPPELQAAEGITPPQGMMPNPQGGMPAGQPPMNGAMPVQ